MEFSPEGRVCSFCGKIGTAETRFAGGLGAMMCLDCLDFYHEIFADPERELGIRRPPWEQMTDAEMLEGLRHILRSQDQSARFLNDWVSLIRDRKISWAAIGRVLGMSRQAAWERFSPEAKAKKASAG